MKNVFHNISRKFYLMLLIISLFTSAFFYNKKLCMENELGTNYLIYIQTIQFQIKQTTNHIETEDADEKTIKNYLDHILILGNTNSSNLISLNFHRILFNTYDQTNINYREDVLRKLTNCHNLLEYTLNDIKEFKQKYESTIMYKFLPERLQGKIYYDYFSQKPKNKSKYNSKFHETFYSGISE